MTDPASPSDPETRPGSGPAAGSLAIDRTPGRRRRRGFGPLVLGLLVVGAVVWLAGGFLFRAGGLLGGTVVTEGRVVRVSRNAEAERTTASGYVVARTRAAISPRIAGKLVRLHVDVGDRVKAGQLLAELDHDEQDATVERARAEVARAESEVLVAEAMVSERAASEARARREVEAAQARIEESRAVLVDARREARRAAELVVDRIVTVSEKDRADTALAVAEAAIDRLEASLATARAEAERSAADVASARARVVAAQAGVAVGRAAVAEWEARREIVFIRAPFAGVVLRKEAEVGEVIAPVTSGGSLARGAVVTLADFDTLEMEVDVFERDLSLVDADAPARIVLDAFPDAPFAGRVRQIVPTADRQKATVQVKVAFDDADRRVLPEMGGKVVFLAPGTAVDTGGSRVLAPGGAVARRGGADGVFLLVDEARERRVRWTAVTLGEAAGDRIEIVEGLTGGEAVVLDPGPDLEDGAVVTVEDV